MATAMSDQTWAVIVGLATVIGLRVVDFFFPKGKWFGWGGNIEADARHAADAEDDADTDVKRRRADRDDDAYRRDRDQRLEGDD